MSNSSRCACTSSAQAAKNGIEAIWVSFLVDRLALRFHGAITIVGGELGSDSGPMIRNELSRHIQCDIGGFNASYIPLKHVMHTRENVE